jgi:hypothetical protein
MNTSAAFPINLARITRHATKAGIGRPPNSVARRSPVAVGAAAATINARRTSSGKIYSIWYTQLDTEDDATMQVRGEEALHSSWWSARPSQISPGEEMPTSRLVVEQRTEMLCPSSPRSSSSPEVRQRMGLVAFLVLLREGTSPRIIVRVD